MPHIPILTAPTAAGKSELALRAAEALARRGETVELVAADAFTVYRGLDIGTAKPEPAERAAAPHHLIDVVDVSESFDVARFVGAAEAAIRDILARGHLPLVVGGTGFYLRALMRGLPLTPPPDPVLRAAVARELEERGLDALLAEIARTNPAEAARMERNPRRVIRALEIHRSSGRFPGEFGQRPPGFAYALCGFTRPDAELRGRIAARIQAMLRSGWPAEAAWLARQVDPATLPRPTVWQALGYPEAWQVSRGELDPDEAATRLAQTTWQYARRQSTFIRTQLGGVLLTPPESELALERSLDRLTALRQWAGEALQ